MVDEMFRNIWKFSGAIELIENCTKLAKEVSARILRDDKDTRICLQQRVEKETLELNILAKLILVPNVETLKQ
jgi:hypothetical protein